MKHVRTALSFVVSKILMLGRFQWAQLKLCRRSFAPRRLIALVVASSIMSNVFAGNAQGVVCAFALKVNGLADYESMSAYKRKLVEVFIKYFESRLAKLDKRTREPENQRTN